MTSIKTLGPPKMLDGESILKYTTRVVTDPNNWTLGVSAGVINEAGNAYIDNAFNTTTKLTGGGGGGVYNAGTLFMYGSAVIGDSSVSQWATGTSDCSNYSSYGGGLYNAVGATAYLGYSAANKRFWICTDNQSDYYIRGHISFESPLLALAWIPGVGRLFEMERVYLSTLSIDHTRPYFELGYGFTNRYFSTGIFASFLNTKFQRIGCRFTIELFRRW